MEKKPKEPMSATVVIGNAGIKSLAALPILEFLQQQNILIERIIGSGGGSTMGALFGCGYSVDEIPALMTRLYDRNSIVKINYRTLLDLAGIPTGRFSPSAAILRQGKQLRIHREIFKDLRLEEASIPLDLQVVDLLSAEGVFLNKGLVSDAVYASSAFYPFLSPIEIDGKWYADGMYTSTLPLLEATRTNAKMIIAIDFSRAHHALPHGLVEYYANSINRTYATMHTSQVSMAMMLQDIDIILIKVSFPIPINLWDNDHAKDIVEAGRRSLEVHGNEILAAYRRGVTC